MAAPSSATAASATSAATATCELFPKPMSLQPKKKSLEAYEILDAGCEIEVAPGVVLKQPTIAREFTPDYVQLEDQGADGNYFYHIHPEKLTTDQVHMFVPARAGVIAARATAVFQTLETQLFPVNTAANEQYKLIHLQIDEETFIHVSIPAKFRDQCERVIKVCGLTICSHKSTVTQLATGATVTIPNAKHVIQFCEKGMGTMRLPARDKAGCDEAQMRIFKDVQEKLAAMDFKDKKDKDSK